MKKLLCMALALIVAGVAGAFAAGDMPYHAGQIVQNLKGIATSKANARCDTTAGTKGVQKTYSTSGYRAVEVEVFTIQSTATVATMTPVATPVRWYLDGKQVGIGPSIALTNPDRSDPTQFQTVAFGIPSSAKRTFESCRRGQ